MTRPRVAIVADMLEEGWPSMDLVAEMLVEQLGETSADTVHAALVRPRMKRRFTSVPASALIDQRHNADRLLNRFWDYPRLMRRLVSEFDLLHVVDHSYAQVLHGLPPRPAVVTCHDLDAFRCLVRGSEEPRSLLFRKMARRILDGLQRADRVICVSRSTRDEILASQLVGAERLVVIPNGVHPSCRPDPDPAADGEANALLGPPGQKQEILHVGSTVPRKRIDTLLRVFAAIHRHSPAARLVRVGGDFSTEQQQLVEDLGLKGAVVVLPSLRRAVLAAVYRRATVLLQPSEREGFGLPVIEALACGLPVAASDISVFREIGDGAVDYAPVGDVEAWENVVLTMLAERTGDPEQWDRRRCMGIAHAAGYSWAANARRTAEVYREMLA